MPDLRHTVTLESIPRRLVEQWCAAVLSLCADTRAEKDVLHLEDEPVPGIRLIAGRHLTPGARYEFVEDDEAGGTDAEYYVPLEADPDHPEPHPLPPGVRLASPEPLLDQLEIAEWSRTGAIRLLLTGRGAESETHGEFTLRNPHRPTSLTARGDFRGRGGFARYRRGELRAALDLDRWWAADGRSPAPLTVGLRHPLLRGTVRVTVKRARDGRWKVTVVTRARGRGWARPLVAVGWAFARSRTREQYRAGLDELAVAWNEELPRAAAHRPEDLRAEALAGLRSAAEEDAGGGPALGKD